MNTVTNIDILSVFIFVGVFLGLILSFFFIFKPSPNLQANRYQGLLLLSLSLCILELLLNLTGYIVKLLPLTFTSASLNFLIGPFLYLFVKRSIDQHGSKREWIHFILPALYLIYLIFDLLQSNEFKYNVYISNYHHDWPVINAPTTISNDPLKINRYLTPLQGIQILLYILLSFLKLIKKAQLDKTNILRTDDLIIKSLRYVILHFLVIMVIFTIVKVHFHSNAGDYFIGIYIAIFTLLTTLRVMGDSSYFDQTGSFLDISIGKYSKSSLTEGGKQKILNNIILEFETRQYYSENLASLSDLAKKIGESPHHVSQVINEKLNKFANY